MAAPTFTPIPMPALPTPPAPPSTPVQNPTTLPRESFLRDQLDPTKATYLGNKYRPELQAAGRQLQSGLEGFGDYTFTEDAQGGLTPEKKQGGQPGRNYRDAYFDARSQAAAAGMLYSRTAEQAVGDAWHRLSEQERGLLNQYAGQESEILGRFASEFTGVTNELLGLYGSDIQYALDHPVIPPDAPAPEAGGGAAGAGGGLAASNPLLGNPYAWGQPGNGRSHAPGAGGGTGGPDAPMWHGTAAPNLQTLSKAWGVPISSLRVTRAGNGQNVVTVKG